MTLCACSRFLRGAYIVAYKINEDSQEILGCSSKFIDLYGNSIFTICKNAIKLEHVWRRRVVALFLFCLGIPKRTHRSRLGAKEQGGERNKISLHWWATFNFVYSYLIERTTTPPPPHSPPTPTSTPASPWTSSRIPGTTAAEPAHHGVTILKDGSGLSSRAKNCNNSSLARVCCPAL